MLGRPGVLRTRTTIANRLINLDTHSYDKPFTTDLNNLTTSLYQKSNKPAMNTTPLFDFSLNEQGHAFMNTPNVFGGGGGPGIQNASVVTHTHESLTQSVQNGRVSKTRKRSRTRRMSALEQARMEADQVRENFKAMKSAEVIKTEKSEDMGGVLNEEVENAAKYERRLQMNRRSAAASRVRRDAYIKMLEKHLQALDDKNKNMESELDQAKEENSQLRQLVPVQPLQNPDLLMPFPDIDLLLDDHHGRTHR